MNALLNFLELLSLMLWLGAIVFFSFLLTPALPRVLGEDQAGKMVRALLPRYYLLGILCGIVLIAVQLLRGLLWYWGGMIKPAIVIFSLLTLLSIYARQALPPTLDRRGRILNRFVLLIGLLYLYWMAVRGY